MAQIKKFQTPAGPITKEEQKKYGRLIQNGVSIDATDDMLGWLDAQGYYGQQIANKIRNGQDQYIDVDDSGTGIIRDVDLSNPDLKEKQQNRTGRSARLVESRRLRDARADIQRLATYDFSKFKAASPKEKSKFITGDLDIDYNTTKGSDGKTTYTFSPTATVNMDILKRMSDIEAGLDAEKYSDAVTINDWYKKWSATPTGESNTYSRSLWEKAKDEVQSGVLSQETEDLLKAIGIYSPAMVKMRTKSTTPVTSEDQIVSDIVGTLVEAGMKEAAAKSVSPHFGVDQNGKIVAKESLTKLFGNNYLFGDNDSGYEMLKGYVLINGTLLPTTGNDFKTWLQTNAGKSFIEAYNAGQWSDAAKTMGFAGSDEVWEYYDPRSQYSDYLEQGLKYRDVSGWYMPGTHIGVVDVLGDELSPLGLRTIKRKVILNDGTLSDDLSGLVKADRPGNSTNPIVHGYSEGPLKLGANVRWIPLTSDGQYWLAVDSSGKKTVYRKNTVGSRYSQKDLNLDTSKASVLDIIRAIQGLGRKYQVGGTLLSTTKAPSLLEIDSAPISDPKKSLDVFKDHGQGLNTADIAEITSLTLDLGALIGGEVPVVGEVAGYGADIAGFVADVSRDGFQWGDLLSLGAGLGLSTAGLIPGVGTASGVGKVVKKLTKVGNRLLMPLFTSYGLVSAADGLTDIIVNGNFTLENARQVMNGLMAIKSIRKNIAGHKAVKEYGESVEGKVKTDAPEAVDAAGKTKVEVADKARSAWEWFENWAMPVDASKYKMRSDLSQKELDLMQRSKSYGRFGKRPSIYEHLNTAYPENWTIHSNKKGGKIKKCDAGDELLPWQQFKPITSVPEFKPSGTIPAKKGVLDTSLEAQRKKFSEGLENAALTHKQQKQAQKVETWAQKQVSKTMSNTEKELARQKSTSIKTGVFGGGNNNKPSRDYVSLLGPVVEGITTAVANKKALAKTKEAIRKEALGSVKSMPTRLPLLDYNLTPIISQFDKDKADVWTKAQQFNKNTSDQRLALANNLATSDRIAEGERGLLDTISKQITSVDLENAKMRAKFAEDERQVADYNRQIMGKADAAELSADAEYIKNIGSNVTKMIAETRENYNKYKSVSGMAKNWDYYMDLYNEWSNMEDGPEKRQKLAQLQMFREMMSSGHVVNPFTGISASDQLYSQLKK